MNNKLLEKIESLQKMVDSFFIKVKCKENYYISPVVCSFNGPAPTPTLIYEKGKTYHYKLNLYDHPNPEFRCVWHTVYQKSDTGEMYPHGTNFSLAEFQTYFECIEE